MVRHDALTLGTATNPAAAAWRTPVRGVRVIAPFVEVEQALRPGAQTRTFVGRGIRSCPHVQKPHLTRISKAIPRLAQICSSRVRALLRDQTLCFLVKGEFGPVVGALRVEEQSAPSGNRC